MKQLSTGTSPGCKFEGCGVMRECCLGITFALTLPLSLGCTGKVVKAGTFNGMLNNSSRIRDKKALELRCRCPEHTHVLHSLLGTPLASTHFHVESCDHCMVGLGSICQEPQVRYRQGWCVSIHCLAWMMSRSLLEVGRGVRTRVHTGTSTGSSLRSGAPCPGL